MYTASKWLLDRWYLVGLFYAVLIVGFGLNLWRVSRGQTESYTHVIIDGVVHASWCNKAIHPHMLCVCEAEDEGTKSKSSPLQCGKVLFFNPQDRRRANGE